MKKIISVLLVLAMLAVCFASCGTPDDEEITTEQTTEEATTKETEDNEDEEETTEALVDVEREGKYNRAFELIAAKDYSEAYELFRELGDYKDSATQLGFFRYMPKKATISENGENFIVGVSYNDKDLPSELVCIDAESGAKNSFAYSYDENGKLVEKVSTYEDGSKAFFDYTYDENGNLSKEVEEHSNGEKYIYEYTYDANGNLIKDVMTFPSGDQYVSERTVDESGKVIKQIDIMPDGEESVTDFTYDAWTKQIKSDPVKELWKNRFLS